jgi:hypothetical protein
MKGLIDLSDAIALNAPRPACARAFALRFAGGPKSALHRAPQRLRALSGEPARPGMARGPGLIEPLGYAKKVARKYFAQ